jgi:hypothetical protein
MSAGRRSCGSIGSWPSFPAVPSGSGMSEAAYSAPTLSRPVRWERVGDLSQRFLLPAVALTTLFLGLILLLDPLARVGAEIPIAVFAIGLGGLAGFISVRGWKSTVPSPAAPMAAAAVTPPSPPGDRPMAVVRAPNDRPRARITARGSEWRVPSAPSITGGGGWLTWLPREHSRAGVEGIEPIPGVVHSSGRAGNLVAFPVRNYFHGVRSSLGSGDLARPSPAAQPSPRIAEVEGRSTPPATSTHGSREPPEPLARSKPLSVEELDRMFPPVSGPRSVFLADAPEKVGGPSYWVRELSLPADPPTSTDEPGQSPDRLPSSPEMDEDSTSSAVRSEGQRTDQPATSEPTNVPRSLPSGGLSRPNAQASDLFREAANPVPPHLRETGGPARAESRRPSGRSTDLASQRSVCASCSKVVVNLRMSGPCPKCLRPICSDCLREAFVTHGHGWCVDCSAAPTVGIG